jgi:hypothetical protein
LISVSFETVHESAINEALWIALSNAALFGSVVTIASMLGAYILCIISARKMGANFSLRKLESAELDRAVLLYEKVFDRPAKAVTLSAI